MSDKCRDGCVTFPGFKGALQQLTRWYFKGKCLDGLNSKEIEDLFGVADTDGNGIIDYEKFQRMLLPQTAATGKWPASHYPENSDKKEPFGEPNCPTLELNDIFARKSGAPLMLFGLDTKLQEATMGFQVKNAFLFPPEVERGTWPENYLLSDHAPLTVVFDPVGLPMTHEAVC